MTDAAWTAIVGFAGILGTGVLGPYAQAKFAARNQAQAAEHAVALGDRAAARALLDEAARAVREAIGRSSAVQSAIITWGNAFGTVEEFPPPGMPRVVGGTVRQVDRGAEAMAAFNQAGRQVQLRAPSIEMMFGRGQPVAAEYDECLNAINRISRGAHMIRGIGDQDYSEYMADVTEGLKEAEDAHRRLLEAGHRTIGLRT